MYSSVNTLWVLVGAALVFFMQAGFAMVETGFTRAKNAGNIIMKNLMDFCIGTPVFWLVGFGIMFGAGNGFFGKIGGIASEANYGNAMLPDGVPFWAFLIFQTVFCATSATIVSGAMAERTKFISYCIYSLLISLVVYPVSGHWIWGGGFISQMGFHDFAGSCAVHMVGGVAALIGAIILGPRIGKYSKSGKSRAIPGHNLTVGALGVFILWFCWFGFNGASTVSMEGDAIASAGKIFVTTNLAAAVATVTVMLITWIRYKKPDVSTRGTHQPLQAAGAVQRFIPAYAGNSSHIMKIFIKASVHPRLRGELQQCSEHSFPSMRFIPAYAGNSQDLFPRITCSTVHPRLRGELSQISPAKSISFGSSPLTRGTRVFLLPKEKELRFIPAYAGNSSRGEKRF